LTGGIAAADCGIPQCLWMPERADPADRSVARSHLAIYGSRLQQSLKRADHLLCYSEHDRERLAGSEPELRRKIRVLPAFPAETVRPVLPGEKEEVKSRWLGGKEYFFADVTGGDEHGVVDMLKAFSFFKKRQHSRMRLVLGGKMCGSPEGIKERIRSYKYRDDIDWSEELGVDAGSLMGAAYCLLLPFEGSSLGVTLLNTWRRGVPAIVVDGGLLQELAGDAALGMVYGDPASLAAQLMRIYKDEGLRAGLIGKGFEQVKHYHRERTLRTVKDGIGWKAAVK
ncbi:MAG TPA: glycosyltransferase, partial [Puia sp.]|nr:glycosyltransferase [Puia sp.]